MRWSSRSSSALVVSWKWDNYPSDAFSFFTFYCDPNLPNWTTSTRRPQCFILPTPLFPLQFLRMKRIRKWDNYSRVSCRYSRWFHATRPLCPDFRVTPTSRTRVEKSMHSFRRNMDTLFLAIIIISSPLGHSCCVCWRRKNTWKFLVRNFFLLRLQLGLH